MDCLEVPIFKLIALMGRATMLAVQVMPSYDRVALRTTTTPITWPGNTIGCWHERSPPVKVIILFQ